MYVRFDIDPQGDIVVLGQLCDPFRDSKADAPGRVARIDTFLKKAHDVFHLAGADFEADCRSVAHGVDDENLDFHLHLVASYWQLPADDRKRREKLAATVFADYFGKDARMTTIHVGVVGPRRDTQVFDVFRMLCTVPDALLRATAMDYCRRIARTPRYNEEQLPIRTQANTRLNIIRAIGDLPGASDELQAFLREGAWTRRNTERCGIFVARVQKVAAAEGGPAFLSDLMDRLPRQHGAWAVRDLDFASRAIARRSAGSSRTGLLGRFFRCFVDDEQARYLNVVLATQDAIHRHVDLGVWTEAAARLMPKVEIWPTVLQSDVLLGPVREIAASRNAWLWKEGLRLGSPLVVHRTAHRRRMASLWAMDLVGQWSGGDVAGAAAAPYDLDRLLADMLRSDPWHAWTHDDIRQVIEAGLRSVAALLIDRMDEAAYSGSPITPERLAALQVALNESEEFFDRDNPAALDVREARAVLARARAAWDGAWTAAAETPASTGLRKRLQKAVEAGLPSGGLAYGTVAWMRVIADVREQAWPACHASMNGCWLRAGRSILMPVSGTGRWARQALGPAQALALEVGPWTHPGPVFKVRVNLWRRRPGNLAPPSADAGEPQHMDRRHWYDTGVVCFEFQVLAL